MKLSRLLHGIAILALVAWARAAELQPTIDAWQAKRSGGIVIGVVTADKVEFHQAGTFSDDDPRPVDPETLFEIGSVTKVFTALLLADAIERGVVKLDDTIGAPFAPSSITYRQLATHTSGLPSVPPISDYDPDDPYATITLASLIDTFAKIAPAAKPSAPAYSNFGFAILGHAIAARNNETWPVSIKQRILEPLGLTDTFLSWREVDAKRLPPGHARGSRMTSWTLDGYAPAGSLVSSARDLTRFVRAALGLLETPLNSAFTATLQRIHWNEATKSGSGLAWPLGLRGTREIAQHSGRTGGYDSFVGLNPQHQRGVVILSNDISVVAPLAPLGLSLLLEDPLPKAPAGKKPVARKEVMLATDDLDAYVGRYELAPKHIFTIKRANDRLSAQLTGQPFLRLYAEGGDKFFYKALEAQLTFERDAEGKVAALTLHQNGRDSRAQRIP